MRTRLSDDPLGSQNDFDAFGYQDLTRRVATLFEKRGSPPSNIAIYGPWGSGKTSLLYLLRKDLETALDKAAPIWVEIDAWAYQTEDTLLYGILARLYEVTSEPVKESLLRIALGTTLSLADLALKLATDKNLSVKDVVENLELAEGTKPFESKHLVLRDEFVRLVGKLKQASAPAPGRHVLIAIDNLDRCKPDAAIKVLEALFLIGNTRDCTFVIAVDQHVLISFLNRHYHGTQFNGARYLEKIFPIAFRIPDPWVYWTYKQAVKESTGTNPTSPDQVYRLLDELIGRSNWDDRATAAPDDSRNTSIFAMVWHYLSQPRILRNPRRIKRVARQILGYDPERRLDHAERLLFLVILADLWPDAFEFFLSTNHASWKSWLAHLAEPTKSAPANGARLDDHGLQEFVYQIWRLHDPERASIDSLTASPIGNFQMLSYHLKHLRQIGL